MANLLIALFWLATFLVLLSYFIYPLLVIYLPVKQKEPRFFDIEDEPALPDVTIIMAAYNEEAVIESKLESVFQTDYPANKISVMVGSDKSSDGTDEIVLNLTRKYPNLQLVRFEKRTGKSGIINTLVALSKTNLLIATDANILFTSDTIYHLIKRFKEPTIHLVGGNIVYNDKKDSGIAVQESVYLNWENKIKQAESKRWWIALGVEGGCYAIRRSAFAKIPPLTFMEDFYMTMAVLHNSGQVWFEPEAQCFEDVSTEISEEFKRKVRISIGNWQNLSRFSGMIFNPFWPVGMAFFAHKVLRWFTPFLIIFAAGIAMILASPDNFFGTLILVALGVILLLPLDFALMKRNMHTGILRFINHFIMMNIALLVGFINYTKGVKSNVWQPTKRNQ
jgi:cellulose synthase/poly-beta-1,6-N-acetylglucosamine synthase-like glycosyltransferase